MNTDEYYITSKAQVILAQLRLSKIPFNLFIYWMLPYLPSVEVSTWIVTICGVLLYVMFHPALVLQGYSLLVGLMLFVFVGTRLQKMIVKPLMEEFTSGVIQATSTLLHRFLVLYFGIYLAGMAMTIKGYHYTDTMLNGLTVLFLTSLPTRPSQLLEWHVHQHIVRHANAEFIREQHSVDTKALMLRLFSVMCWCWFVSLGQTADTVLTVAFNTLFFKSFAFVWLLLVVGSPAPLQSCMMAVWHHMVPITIVSCLVLNTFLFHSYIAAHPHLSLTYTV